MLVLIGVLSTWRVMAVLWPLMVIGDVEKLMKSWKIEAMVVFSGALLLFNIGWILRVLWPPAELRVQESRLDWLQSGKLAGASTLQDVYASPSSLLVGSKLIRFRMYAGVVKPWNAMFDMDVFDKAVLARIPPGQLVSEQKINWIAFKRQPLALRIFIGGLLLAALMLFFAPLFR